MKMLFRRVLIATSHFPYWRWVASQLRRPARTRSTTHTRGRNSVEDVNAARAELAGIDVRVQEIAARVEAQTADVELVTTELEETRKRIADLEGRFETSPPG